MVLSGKANIQYILANTLDIFQMSCFFKNPFFQKGFNPHWLCQRLVKDESLCHIVLDIRLRSILPLSSPQFQDQDQLRLSEDHVISIFCESHQRLVYVCDKLSFKTKFTEANKSKRNPIPKTPQKHLETRLKN